MRATLPASPGHPHTAFHKQPRILLDTSTEQAAANQLRRTFARSLVRLGLSREMGVYVAKVSRHLYGCYLGRHDGQPVTVTPAVIHAATRLAGKRA